MPINVLAASYFCMAISIYVFYGHLSLHLHVIASTAKAQQNFFGSVLTRFMHIQKKPLRKLLCLEAGLVCN